MNFKIKKSNLREQIGFGLSGGAVISTFCLCFAAIFKQSLFIALLSVIACSLFSIKLNNSIFAPNVFYIVPLFYVFTLSDFYNGALSILLGSFFLIILDKLLKFKKPDKGVTVAVFLGLAIGGTILLTNCYFGIGSVGEAPLSMLKSFRSLGFHPHFMGLLYGTITLFAMITYPFKFKKLNKYLPGEFITIFLPFIINLLLNPDASHTPINEADFNSIFIENIPKFEGINIGVVLPTAFAFGIIMYFIKSVTESNNSKYFFGANLIGGTLSGMPVAERSSRGFGYISAFVSIAVCTVLFVFCPTLLGRIPMHSIGAMLIVSLWNSVPYKYFKDAFKGSFIKAILVIFIAVAFFATNIFTACLISVAISLILRKDTKA